MSILSLTDLELSLKSAHLEMMEERFSMKSLYMVSLHIISVFLGIVLCAIVGINSINALLFVILEVVLVLIFVAIYKSFHPNHTFYHKSEVLVQNFVSFPWQSQEARGLLLSLLDSAQAGLFTKDLQKIISLEKRARRINSF